jgi:hypothetical protein
MCQSADFYDGAQQPDFGRFIWLIDRNLTHALEQLPVSEALAIEGRALLPRDEA